MDKEESGYENSAAGAQAISAAAAGAAGGDALLCGRVAGSDMVCPECERLYRRRYERIHFGERACVGGGSAGRILCAAISGRIRL